MEDFSDTLKRGRGRPKRYKNNINPEIASRTAQNRANAVHAVNILSEHGGVFSALIGRKRSLTLLCELGRCVHPETIIDAAQKIVDAKPTHTQAIAMLRAARAGVMVQAGILTRVPSQSRLADRIWRFSRKLKETYPGLTNQQLVVALDEVSFNFKKQAK
jgi:hypothetical protein